MSTLRLPVDLACRRGLSFRWGIGVSSPSAAGVGGCAGREAVESEIVLGLKSGELPSVLNAEWAEIEGEGGITLTFRLEPPSEGTSSGAASVVGNRSSAGVIRI